MSKRRPRLPHHTLMLAGATLLGVFTLSDHASALPKVPIDPSDPLVDPIFPIRPPSCPAPTLKQCQDTTYLASSCGPVTKPQCGKLVAPLYQSEVRAVSETTKVLKSSGGAETLQTAKLLTPLPMPARKLTFGTLSFATAAQLGRVLPPSAETANLASQHPAYEANGAAVASCQEYAYESLYDDERFVEAAESCGSNAECVYQLSLRTSTPGLKTTMLKKNGQPMSTQKVRPGTYAQLKNGFFVKDVSELRSHPDYATSAAFRTKAEQIIAHVLGTPKATATSELAWHRSMHDAFVAAPPSPAELVSIRQRVERYSDVASSLAVSKFAIPLLEAVIPGQSGAARATSEALLATYKAQRARAIADMAPKLFAEWDHVSPLDGKTPDRGCLSRTAITCDWSPAKFVSRYARHLRDSETLFSECVEATANDFSKVPAAYRADTDQLAMWLAGAALPKLGASVVGERTSDADQWGDQSWFAAGYSYDAGWSLAADRQAGTNRICKLKGSAYAQASASAWALGAHIPVLDTRHSLSVRESNDAIKYHSHLRVLNQDVYGAIDGTFTAPSITPLDKKYDKQLAQRTYEKWFTVAGVGVKLKAHVELKAGAEITARATAASGCNPDNLAYDAALSVRPWINVHVVPEVSVGIGIIQGGVRGDVDLLEVSVPASGSVKLIGGVNDISLQMRADARLDIEALEGKLSVFLESCLPYVGCADLASKQIYAWDGYAWQFPLFGYSKDVKINVFNAATLPSAGPGGGLIGGGGVLAPVASFAKL